MQDKKDFKLLIKKILILLPILFLIFFVNYFIDSVYIFSHDNYEKRVAEILLEGKNAKYVSNYDDRLFQKYYIDGLTKAKDIVVIGSSRCMQISSDLFPNKTFFNSWVMACGLEDMIGIYEIYKEKNLLPSTLIIGLEAWMMNKNYRKYGNYQWRSISEYYYRSLETMNIKREISDYINFNNSFWYKVRNLFNIGNFQNSISMYFNKMFNNDSSNNFRRVLSNEEIFSDFPNKISDGSYNFGKKYENMDSIEILNLAKDHAMESPIRGLGSFQGIGERNKLIFEGFLNLVRNDKVQIIFFIPPYHPYLFETIMNNENYKIIMDVQKYYLEIAKKYNLKVFGSFNPTECGLSNKDFYDGNHGRGYIYKKIFEDYIKSINLK
jgi:hypothetical protein